MTQLEVLFGIHDPKIADHAIALSRQLQRAGSKVFWAWSSKSQPAPDGATLEQLAKVGASLEVWDDNGGLARPWSAIFVQTPYDEQRSEPWATLSASDNLAYAGYGPPISNWIRGQYELPFFRRCSHILHPTPVEGSPYLANGVGLDRLFHTGDPLLFELIERSRTSAPPHEPNLLWMPHWTFDWFGSPGYSTWAETVFDVLHVAEEAPSSRFVVRPHPLLSRTLAENEPGDSPPMRAYRTLLDLPNVEVSNRDLISDLLGASAVITDGASSLTYGGAVGMPLGICRRPDSPPFGRFGKRILGVSDTLIGSDNRRRWLWARIAQDPSQGRNEERRQTVLSCFPLHERSPGELFVERLSDLN